MANRSISPHSDPSIVASASEDNSIKIWDFETAQYERTLKGQSRINCLSVSGFISSEMTISHTLSYHSISFLLFNDYQAVLHGAYCHNIVEIISRERKHVHVVVYISFITTKLPASPPTGHTEAVTGLAFDPSGNNLASCSADMSAKIWDLATYICIKTLKV